MKVKKVNWIRVLLITAVCLALNLMVLGYKIDTIEAEKQQVRDIKMDRIYRYCKESPICNKLDEEFTKFSSGIAVGRFE